MSNLVTGYISRIGGIIVIRQYSETRYPIKAFTVLSKICNKVLKKQYYIVRKAPIKATPYPPSWLATQNDEFETVPCYFFACPSLINMTTMKKAP